MKYLPVNLYCQICQFNEVVILVYCKIQCTVYRMLELVILEMITACKKKYIILFNADHIIIQTALLLQLKLNAYLSMHCSAAT